MGDLKESQNSGPLCSQKPSPLTVLGVSRGRGGESTHPSPRGCPGQCLNDSLVESLGSHAE